MCEKIFENLFKFRRAIADFIGVVNFEISLLRQIRIINLELIYKEEILNNQSNFINFIP